MFGTNSFIINPTDAYQDKFLSKSEKSDLDVEIINSDTNLHSNYIYLCDVENGGFEITLPEEPKNGDTIRIFNYKGSFKDNNVIIKSDKKINNSNEYKCKLDSSVYELKYYENIDEWLLIIVGTQNLGSLFAEFMCEIPELSNQSADEINEGDYIEIDIDNYDENAEYLVDNELVTKFVYKSDKTFKVYFGNVDEDTDTTFRVRAIKTGYISSSWSDEISITVKDKPEEEDDAIINDAFADNKDTSSDCDVTNDKVVFTKDGGEYKEVITEQGDDEEDWSSYQTIAKIELEKMNIYDDDTDTDTLAVKNKKIKDVSKCYITNDDYPDGVEIDIGDVEDESNEDTTNTLDIFGDDSCIACYNFDGDATDLSGNYDGTTHGDISYVDGFFDKGIRIDDEDEKQYVSVDEITDIKDAFTYSCWVTNPDDYDDEDYYAYVVANENHDRLYGLVIHYNDSDNDNNNKIECQLDGDNQLLSIPDDKTIEKEDKLFFVYSWDKSKNDGKPSVYIKNETQDYEYTLVFDDLATTDDLDKGFDVIAGINSTYDNRIAIVIDQVRIFNKVVSDDEIDILYNEQITKYKADISSNDLDNAPENAYFIEENITIKTALTKDNDPTDDDFNDEDLDTWKIDTDNDYKENSYKKVSDYSGNKFQRKITGDKNANITYLKSNMWKDS